MRRRRRAACARSAPSALAHHDDVGAAALMFELPRIAALMLFVALGLLVRLTRSVAPSVSEGPGGTDGAPTAHPDPSLTLGMTTRHRAILTLIAYLAAL